MTDLCNEQYSIFLQIIGGGAPRAPPPYSYGPATIMRHQEDKQSKVTSSLSLSPIETIAKLEWTQSNAQQNIEQL